MVRIKGHRLHNTAYFDCRYKLLSTTTTDKEAQTDLSYEEESSSVLDAARSEILSLQTRNQVRIYNS